MIASSIATPIASLARRTARLPLGLAALALFAMMALTFADVLMRSLADAPIPGAAEITEVLLATTVFAAMPALSFLDRHIAVDLMDTAIPPRLARWRDAAVNIVFGLALLWPLEKCWVAALRTLGYGEVTLYLRLPVGWIAIGIVIGLGASAAAMVLRGVLLIARPRLV